MRTRSIEAGKYWINYMKNYQGHGKVIIWKFDRQKESEVDYKCENLRGEFIIWDDIVDIMSSIQLQDYREAIDQTL